MILDIYFFIIILNNISSNSTYRAIKPEPGIKKKKKIYICKKKTQRNLTLFTNFQKAVLCLAEYVLCRDLINIILTAEVLIPILIVYLLYDSSILHALSQTFIWQYFLLEYTHYNWTTVMVLVPQNKLPCLMDYNCPLIFFPGFWF